MSNKSNRDEENNISTILSNTEKVRQIIQLGIKAALKKHKQAGNPICEWRDNKITWIPPEKIPV